MPTCFRLWQRPRSIGTWLICESRSRRERASPIAANQFDDSGGANAIVVFPISPIGLNNAVKAACAKGVIIVAYAADIDVPCAYIVTIDEKQVGLVTGQWLADELKGKGRVALVTGVAGTSVDADGTNGAKTIFAKYPDMKIVAEVNGNWSQATARQELAKVVPPSDGTGSTAFGCRLAVIRQPTCSSPPAWPTRM